MYEGLHRKGRFGLGLMLAVAAATFGPISGAGAAVNGSSDANAVANSMSGLSGAFSGPFGPDQAGIGDSPLSGFPTSGSTFGVLTSGDATLADDPNDAESSGEGLDNSDPARGSAIDPITLRVDVDVPAGNTCLLLDFKFFSEEFPEFVNSGFNDGFIAELDTTDWSITSDPVTGAQKINAPNDFAAGYGDQVSVDTVGPTLVSEANSVGTTYDAGTQLITTKVPVTPGAHAVYLSVFDAGDAIYDSAAFIDNIQFNAEPPSTCKAADIFGGALGVVPTEKKIDFNGKVGEYDLSCQLPVGASDPCIGKISITAKRSGNAGKRAKKAKVAKGTYSVPPPTTVDEVSVGQAQVKLTKKGKKLFKAQNKAKAKAKLTNTVNGVTQSFKVKIKK